MFHCIRGVYYSCRGALWELRDARVFEIILKTSISMPTLVYVPHHVDICSGICLDHAVQILEDIVLEFLHTSYYRKCPVKNEWSP